MSSIKGESVSPGAAKKEGEAYARQAGAAIDSTVRLILPLLFFSFPSSHTSPLPLPLIQTLLTTSLPTITG